MSLKRKFSLFLLLATMLYLPQNYVIADMMTQTNASIMSENLKRCNRSFSITNGTAYISIYVVGISGTQSVQIATTLQRYSSGKWSTIVTYHGSGTSSASVIKTRALTVQGDYRIITLVILNGWETLTFYDYASY